MYHSGDIDSDVKKDMTQLSVAHAVSEQSILSADGKDINTKHISQYYKSLAAIMKKRMNYVESTGSDIEEDVVQLDAPNSVCNLNEEDPLQSADEDVAQLDVANAICSPNEKEPQHSVDEYCQGYGNTAMSSRRFLSSHSVRMLHNPPRSKLAKNTRITTKGVHKHFNWFKEKSLRPIIFVLLSCIFFLLVVVLVPYFIQHGLGAQDDICTKSTKTLDSLRSTYVDGSMIHFDKEKAHELFTNLFTKLKYNESGAYADYTGAKCADNKGYVCMTFDQISNYVIEKLQENQGYNCCNFETFGSAVCRIACNNDCFNRLPDENCEQLSSGITDLTLSQLTDAELKECGNQKLYCSSMKI